MNDVERRKLKIAYEADARRYGFPLSYVPAMVAETERHEALAVLHRVDPDAWARASETMRR